MVVTLNYNYLIRFLHLPTNYSDKALCKERATVHNGPYYNLLLCQCVTFAYNLF
jgi:hypothetical protein